MKGLVTAGHFIIPYMPLEFNRVKPPPKKIKIKQILHKVQILKIKILEYSTQVNVFFYCPSLLSTHDVVQVNSFPLYFLAQT